MNLEDFTPFVPAAFVSAKDGSGYISTVLVKAAFGLRHQGVVEALEKQLLPQGDSFPDGTDPPTSSPKYASDFASCKLRADVLLHARGYRPQEQPRGSYCISVRVGDWAKQLTVFPAREVEQGLFSSSIVERESYAATAIIYENAFGGPSYAANPVGRGYKANEVPLIEYPDRRLAKPGETSPPAGFGPIAPEWEPRKSLVGTPGPDYLEKHWPGFPGDFDERFFNAAPVDQQVDGFLRGDEEIVLENLHSEHANFVTRLPGWRVVCLRENADGACELVPLVIDTLWISPDDEQIVLLWRGRMKVKTPDALEIKRLGFMLTPSSSSLQDVSYYQRQLQSLIDERDAEFEPEHPADESNSKSTGTEEPQPPAADADDEELWKIKAQIAELRAKAGHPPPEDEVPPVEAVLLTPEGQAKYDEIVGRIEEEDRQRAAEEEAKKWTREKVIAAVKAKRPFEDADLSELDLSGCDFAGADFRGAKLSGVDFTRSVLSRALLATVTLERARFDFAKLDDANLVGANCLGASFEHADLHRARLIAADLTDANLDGASLSEAVAEHTVFNGASLAATILTRSNLMGAVLSGAKAPKADFGEAKLPGAACDHADFVDANFRAADVSEANFSASTVNGANFEQANASNADFAEAELVGASFRGANCEGMWLSSAKADRTNFAGAVCIDMQLDGTSAKLAIFTGCSIASLRGSEGADLSGANFQAAQGVEPIFESCRLDGADFSLTDIPGANFVHATAVEANFTAAEMKGARFDYADCRNAKFVAANLFEANFAGVNLAGADVSDANFYGAEFLDARVKNMRLGGCNLQMTKLEKWSATKTQ